MASANRLRRSAGAARGKTQIKPCHFGDVIDQLSPDQLTQFFLKLGVSDLEIAKAQLSSPHTHVDLKARDVFRFWVQTQGKKANLQAVLDALKQCQFKDTHTKLMKKWGIKSSKKTKTVGASSVSTSSRSQTHFRREQATSTPSSNVESSETQPMTINQGCLTLLNAKATESDFRDVVEAVGLREDLQRFYRCLDGMNAVQVERAIDTANARAADLEGIAVLRKWQQINGNKATRGAIIDAMKRETVLKDAMDILKEKWQ